MRDSWSILPDSYIPVRSNKSAEAYLLFLLWPFAGFLYALRCFHEKFSPKIIYLFFILYGLTFIIGNEGLDSQRYAYWLMDAAGRPFSDFLDIVFGPNGAGRSFDFLEPLLRFVVSRFTDDPNILFAAFAAVFGYFYLGGICLLHSHYRENRNINTLIYFIFFTALLPIFHINGFRFWTASWIFFYGAYHVVIDEKRKFLWLSLAAALVHFSFFSANAVLIFYAYMGNRNKIYYPLFLASFFIDDLLIQMMPYISGYLPFGMGHRILLYTNQQYILARAEALENTRWILQWADTLLLYFIIFAVSVIKTKYKTVCKKVELNNLFSFLLLFISFTNFGQAVPSFGGRFQIVLFLFGFLYISIAFKYMRINGWHFITLIGLFPMLISAVINLRKGIETINFFLFAPSPMIALGEQLTVYDLFGDLPIYKLIFN